jgi:hypothetical protein
MLRRINRPMLDLCTGILTKVVVASPVRRRPDRSCDEAPAAVRVGVVKDLIDARGAERGLIGADA